MTDLIVVTFEDTVEAEKALDSLKSLGHEGMASIKDSAVVVKDESGEVHVKNKADTGEKWGAFGGSLVGLMIAGIFFPIAGLAIGAGIGALVGKMAHLNVDQKMVKEVRENMKPGSSALFVMVSGDPGLIVAAFRPYQGTLFQSTLPTEQVEALQDALKAD
jgi:uncharacterized membrane protein